MAVHHTNISLDMLCGIEDETETENYRGIFFETFVVSIETIEI